MTSLGLFQQLWLMALDACRVSPFSPTLIIGRICLYLYPKGTCCCCLNFCSSLVNPSISPPIWPYDLRYNLVPRVRFHPSGLRSYFFLLNWSLYRLIPSFSEGFWFLSPFDSQRWICIVTLLHGQYSGSICGPTLLSKGWFHTCLLISFFVPTKCGTGWPIY